MAQGLVRNPVNAACAPPTQGPAEPSEASPLPATHPKRRALRPAPAPGGGAGSDGEHVSSHPSSGVLSGEEGGGVRIAECAPRAGPQPWADEGASLLGPPAAPKPHAHAADPAGTSAEERVPGSTGRRIRAEGPNHPGW